MKSKFIEVQVPFHPFQLYYTFCHALYQDLRIPQLQDPNDHTSYSYSYSYRALSNKQDYKDIEREEKGFTWYANKQRDESYAEHGGYIAYMEANPSEQHKWIEIKHVEDGKLVTRKINYEEYKQIYPKHYAYFMEKFKEGF